MTDLKNQILDIINKNMVSVLNSNNTSGYF